MSPELDFDNVDSNPSAVIEKSWKPNEKGQSEVLAAPDSIFEILGGGAAGGGKTDLGILLPAVRQFTEHPKFKGLVLRRTFPDLEKEIVPRQQEWYAPMGATYNETKKLWKFPSGAKIQNGHAEREDDVRKYDSAEYNYIDWDESTHFTKFQYLYLSISRCRSSSPDLPAIVRSFTNPGNVGHLFFKERFVDPAPRGRKILIDKVTKLKRMYIPFLGSDNPWLSINDPGYLGRLEGLPEAERLAKLFGNWDAYEGQVFSEFRVLRIPGEPENALHVIDTDPKFNAPYDIPAWWPKFIAIDWGWEARTICLWGAVSPSGRLYLYRCMGWTKTLIKDWTRDIVNVTGQEIIEGVTICHSAGQHRGEPLTIREQVYEAFDAKYEIELAERDRVGGKNLIHEYLRFKQKVKLLRPETKYDGELAAKILRINGEEAYTVYLNLFVPEEDEDNLPKLQILSHSPEGLDNREVIDVIPACVPDKTNLEDVAEFVGDDPYDALRMLVRKAFNYVEQSKSADDKRNKIQQVVNELQRTQNQTNFYLQMEKLERESGEITSCRRHKTGGMR